MPLNVGYLTSDRTIKGDELYTPAYAVKPIIKYLKPNSTIWCPFDLDNSNFVKVLTENGFKVINSHIDAGEDFFTTNYDCDYIVSNPPFSRKIDVLARLFELDKPFAIIWPLPSIQIQRGFDYVSQCEILLFDKRIRYHRLRDMSDPLDSSISFATLYLCHNILPEKIIFEKIETDTK